MFNLFLWYYQAFIYVYVFDRILLHYKELWSISYDNLYFDIALTQKKKKNYKLYKIQLILM